MLIDGNAMELRLQGIIDDVISELGGGGEIKNIGWTFSDTVHSQDKTKRQVTGVFTGNIKKTFAENDNDEENTVVAPCDNNTIVPLKFTVSVSCVTDDLTPPIIP
jgi:hypothetical protein